MHAIQGVSPASREKLLLHEVSPRPGSGAGDHRPGLDVGAALHRRDEVVNHLGDDNQVPWLTDRGIHAAARPGPALRRADAFVSATTMLLALRVLIATGSGALFPPIPGLAEAGAWSNREITTAQEPPLPCRARRWRRRRGDGTGVAAHSGSAITVIGRRCRD